MSITVSPIGRTYYIVDDKTGHVLSHNGGFQDSFYRAVRIPWHRIKSRTAYDHYRLMREANPNWDWPRKPAVQYYLVKSENISHLPLELQWYLLRRNKYNLYGSVSSKAIIAMIEQQIPALEYSDIDNI